MNFDQLHPDKRKEIERDTQKAWDAASCSDTWIAPFDIVFEKVKGIKDIDTLGTQKVMQWARDIIDQFYLIAVSEMNLLPQTKVIKNPDPDGARVLLETQKHSLGDAAYRKTKEVYELVYIITRSGKKVYGITPEKPA